MREGDGEEEEEDVKGVSKVREESRHAERSIVEMEEELEVEEVGKEGG